MSSEVVVKLLDWPFLLFVLVLTFLLVFRKHVAALLNRGDITISWGPGRSISLKDIGESLGQELDAMTERLDALEAHIGPSGDAVTAGDSLDEGPAPPAPAPGGGPSRRPDPDHLQTVKARALSALEDPRYEWRTLDRVATLSGSTADEVRQVLRTDPAVTFGSTRTGDPLLKLKRRDQADD
jgi:hypothetical protein